MTPSSKLANGQAALIEVRDSKLHGLGVFACVDLPKGSVIERCFYLVIDDDDLQEINRLNDYLHKPRCENRLSLRFGLRDDL